MSCLLLVHNFVSGKWSYCWCLMLHSMETLDLATWLLPKAKFVSAGCEIVLLTRSSFKTHVHLLHVVIVNQALRPCSLSSFPSAISFSWILLCYALPLFVEMYMFAYSLHLLHLKSYFNKYKTRNFATFTVLTFLQFGLRPPTVSPKETDFTHIC